jgi:glycine cleavage system H protein
MPLSGEVLEFNEKLQSKPELINSDPYGEGWIIKISIKDKSEIGNLLSNEDYASLINV